MPGIEEQFNLNIVAAEDRATAWRDTAPQMFPGLAVLEIGTPSAGASMSGFRFGPGTLWAIASPPLKVRYSPDGIPLQRSFFSVMLQTQGCTIAAQAGRTCLLKPGDLCVIDNLLPFELEVTTPLSQFSFLQIPRETVLSRHAYLEQRTAMPFDTRDSGVHLLRQTLRSALDLAPTLNADQRSAALMCITQLLGMGRLPRQESAREVSWRVRAALTLIEAELSSPHLNAGYVADRQSISRRRLDQLLMASIGASISAHICSRRIERSAECLTDPQFAAASVAQVALSVGFEDAAHFTRAFKQRFHCTPLQWRKQRSAPYTATSVPGAPLPRSASEAPLESTSEMSRVHEPEREGDVGDGA